MNLRRCPALGRLVADFPSKGSQYSALTRLVSDVCSEFNLSANTSRKTFSPAPSKARNSASPPFRRWRVSQPTYLMTLVPANGRTAFEIEERPDAIDATVTFEFSTYHASKTCPHISILTTPAATNNVFGEPRCMNKASACLYARVLPYFEKTL